jgi:gluconolactonase
LEVISCSVLSQVWFASYTVNNASNISVLDLGSSKIFTPNTSIPIVNPNGGYYFNGKVYFTGQGSATVAPNIYEIDPDTYETKIVVNSYFGLRFLGPNDLAWVKRGKKSYLFFTDDPQSYYFTNGQYPVLPDAVWRYDPQEQSIVPVVSRADVLIPNGLTVSADMKKLYVTDTPFSKDQPRCPFHPQIICTKIFDVALITFALSMCWFFKGVITSQCAESEVTLN